MGCPVGMDKEIWLSAEKKCREVIDRSVRSGGSLLDKFEGLKWEDINPNDLDISDYIQYHLEGFSWAEYVSYDPLSAEYLELYSVEVKYESPTVPAISNSKTKVNEMTCWDLLRDVIGTSYRVLLYGPSGTGKSWAARKFNVKEGEEIYSVTLTEEMPAAELRGHYGVKGGSHCWMDGPATMAWRNGSRLCINELEKANGDIYTYLLGVLDDHEIAMQTLPTGEMIRPKDSFHVVATMNGNPNELDPALRDRFPIKIEVDSVSPEALQSLSPDLRNLAANFTIAKDKARSKSIRSWAEFDRLRKKMPADKAARLVFEKQDTQILDAIKAGSFK